MDWSSKMSGELRVEDEVLLLHGLILMAGADKKIEPHELDTLRAIWNTVPEFRDKDKKDFDKMYSKVSRITAQYDKIEESIKALAYIEKESIRKRLFVLAADLAMSNGIPAGKKEREMLEEMKKILKIDDVLAEKVVDVLRGLF